MKNPNIITMESKELSPIEELYNEYLKVKPLGLKLKIDIDYYLAKEQSRESTFKKQIEELQSQLAEKDGECDRLELIIIERDNTIQRMAARMQEMDREHQSELTSLKEKHKHTKQDVIDAFNSGYTDCEIDNNISDKRSVSEFSNASDYYTQTHEKE